MPMIDTPFLETLSRFLDINATRHQAIVSNLANIDTPHYHTRDVDFRQEMERASNGLSYASVNPAMHEVRGLMERPDGNNVSVERESLLLAETQLRFQTGVALVRSEFRRVNMAINEGRTV
jgi:flagellar basal-body rod protein FlgB